jgi:hypothetical protein
VHTGKELEAHLVEKGRLSCDSDAPQVGSARSDSTRVVKVKCRKANRRKMRPYCIVFREKDWHKHTLHANRSLLFMQTLYYFEDINYNV